MIRAKTSSVPAPTEKQAPRNARKSTGRKGSRKKGKQKRKAKNESEEEEASLSEEEESEFEGDILSPLFGKGRSLRRELPIASLQQQRSLKEPDEESDVLEGLLQSDVVSSRALTASPPPEPILSEPLSEAVSEVGEEDNYPSDPEESTLRPKALTKSPDYMERFLMERAQKERNIRVSLLLSSSASTN
jgi:hypothetical protein